MGEIKPRIFKEPFKGLDEKISNAIKGHSCVGYCTIHGTVKHRIDISLETALFSLERYLIDLNGKKQPNSFIEGANMLLDSNDFYLLNASHVFVENDIKHGNISGDLYVPSDYSLESLMKS